MRLPLVRLGVTGLLLTLCFAACGADGGTEADPAADRDASTSFADASSCAATCGGECCTKDEFCALGARCAPVQKPCSTADDCWFDSYCAGGICTPYELPPAKTHDESCKVTIDVKAIVPAVQCRWTGPPPGDAHPDGVLWDLAGPDPLAAYDRLMQARSYALAHFSIGVLLSLIHI